MRPYRTILREELVNAQRCTAGLAAVKNAGNDETRDDADAANARQPETTAEPRPACAWPSSSAWCRHRTSCEQKVSSIAVLMLH